MRKVWTKVTTEAGLETQAEAEMDKKLLD